MATKNKTHKATKKRFKVTAKGKLVHKRQGNNNHYMRKMSSSHRARVEGTVELSSKKEAKKIKQLGNF